MSDKSNEQISNLMDGELEVNASKFLLKRMAADKTLSKTWNSYHLIKSCLQKDAQQPLIIDVASNVINQLSNNSRMINNDIVPETVHVNRWLKPLIGVGIAASVAFMSVFMLQSQQGNGLDIDGTHATIAQNNLVKPIKTAISANVATSDVAIVPPPSLSRFPSNSAKSLNNFNQGYSNSMNMPYLLIINHQPYENSQLSPLRIKDVSD
jgi:negative regulator of sigma E activity